MAKIDYDTTVSKTLLQRFADEARLGGAGEQHYGIVLRDDGDLAVWNPNSPDLDPMQIIWAAGALSALNRELHHNGAWVVVFTNPLRDPSNPLKDKRAAHYSRYVLLWLDQDGDPSLPIEWTAGQSEMRDFGDVVTAGIHATLTRCETAWDLWNLHMREVLDPKSDQLYKRAKGQVAPSTKH